MNYRKFLPIFILLLAALFQIKCKTDFVPKPKGFIRIDLPEKSYSKFDNFQPFTFELPTYSDIIRDASKLDQEWFNVKFRTLNADLHLTYFKVDKRLSILTEESRDLVYKHSIRAMSIDEQQVFNEKSKVYGTIYTISGNAASPMQFYVTDSVSHFLRGSLYINTEPNYDSLLPVIQFIEADIYRLVETLKWK